jgi:hypothetical protein
MATNPYDVLVPLLQRMHGLAPQLGTDLAQIDKQSYDVAVLNVLTSAVILRILQKLNPTVVTDAALMTEFDHALDLLAGQSWETVTKRTALLGTDPSHNPWM